MRPTRGMTQSAKHKDVDMVSFTGSKFSRDFSIKERCRFSKKNYLRINKSPNLVFSDCNLEERVNGWT